MFYGEIKIKQCLFYISFCPFRILYNSKLIIMATFLGTNVVVVEFSKIQCLHKRNENVRILQHDHTDDIFKIIQLVIKHDLG